jgi:hypothetical protein
LGEPGKGTQLGDNGGLDITEYPASIFRRKDKLPASPVEIPASISVVMMIWKRDPYCLYGSLGMFSRQTVQPTEIIVVNANPDKKEAGIVDEICASYPLVRVIKAPRDAFSMSWGLNVGIKNTMEDSVYVMITGCEMLFSINAIELLVKQARPNNMILAPCGFMPEDVMIPMEPWLCWNELAGKAIPPKGISGGTLILARRTWWFEVHGYDEEHHPFNYADSDVSMRANMSGLAVDSLPWDEAQILHPWHQLSPQYYGVSSAFANPKWGIVRNPKTWGEIDDKFV